MTEWKCQKCGYTLKAEKPPEECPSCKEKCEFTDVFPVIHLIAAKQDKTSGCRPIGHKPVFGLIRSIP